MKKVHYLFYCLTLFACSGNEKSTQGSRINSVQVADTINSSKGGDGVAEAPVSKPVVSTRSVGWQYQKTINEERETIHKASLDSPTLLQFGFPYTGGSTAALTIRQRQQQPATVYLQVSNGQFNRSFQGGRVRIRFDGKPAVTYTYSAAENGSATIIFFDEAGELIRQLKAAKRMVIDVAFYGQGNRQIEFRTAGLVWNHS
ncbi:hypothetical protein [Spirosoma spitsbergense]|uniref:hypothetical protein n=1 Tax=Spirosoma spitsbergense TaxID=431554 RepID=UPI000360CD70|nr:hypothetical protein [Spirosoma spitsbergense]